MNKGNEEQIDPRLAELLEELRDTPARLQEAGERSRQRFLSQVESLPASKPITNKSKEGSKMVNPKRRLVLTSVIVIVAAVLFLFGGSALTVMASQSALPGDTLYGIKTSYEQTRASLARDAGDRAELQIEYAGRRLEEIERLVAEGRYRNIADTTVEFENHIQNALAEMEIVSAQDPERAARILQQITTSLARYANALSIMLSNAPDSVQADMLRALQIARQAGGIDNENDNTNDNQNENANENINDNENDNLNANDNFNDNLNDNQNSNTSGDCTFSSVTVDELTVPQNATCTLNGTRVEGNIFVHGNATLLAYDVWVGGNIQADRSARVEVHSGSYVGGNIQVDYSGLLLLSSVRIGGNLQAFNNWGSQSYTGNMIGGDLQAFDNSGGVSIKNNTIEGNLQCKDNYPAPTGSGNTVYGNYEDQCFTLNSNNGHDNFNDNQNSNTNWNDNNNDDDDNDDDDDDNDNDDDDD